MKINKSQNIYQLIGIWLVTVLIWALYRYLFLFPEWVDELLIKPMLYIGPVLIFLKIRGNLNKHNLGLSVENWRTTLAWGLGFGLILVMENSLIWYIKGSKLNYNFFSRDYLFLAFFISISTAVAEEILYRGFLLRQFLNITPLKRGINIFVSLLFTLSHIPMVVLVLNYSGQELLAYIALIFILGFINGLLFIRTNNVLAPVIMHTMWNFSIGLFI